MPVKIKPLTDKDCQTPYTTLERKDHEAQRKAGIATPASRDPYTKRDGDGLALDIHQSGRREWRMNYRLDGKRPSLHLGSYPEMSLAEAREARARIRGLVRAGIDPIKQRVLDKARREGDAAIPPFRAAATAWVNEFFGEHRVAAGACGTVTRCQELRFVRYLCDAPVSGGITLGDLPVNHPEIADHILGALRRWSAKPQTRIRMQTSVKRIMDFAAGKSYLPISPIVHIRWATKFARVETVHTHPCQIEPAGFGAVLRKIEAYGRSPASKYCPSHGIPKRRIAQLLGLQALCWTRPSELRKAEWTHFDLERKVWSVPFHLLKQRTFRRRRGQKPRPHEVPLSRQAVALLADLKQDTGHGRFLFPGTKTANVPIADTTVRNAMRAMGIDTQAEQDLHGFRGSAKTMLKKSRRFSHDAIEWQLNHVNDDSYDHDDCMDERIEMMQFWADKIDIMRDGAQVLPLPVRRKITRAHAS